MLLKVLYSQRGCESSKALHVSMPIMHEVNQVLSFGKSPKEAVIDLLSREQKSETH